MDLHKLWHFIPMIVGVVILAIAAWIGSTDKGIKRLMTHKAAAGAGVVIVLLGVAWLVVAKALEPDLIHFYSALVASVFVIVTPFGGLLTLRAVPAKKAGLRRIHRLGAATVLALSILTMVLGMLDK